MLRTRRLFASIAEGRVQWYNGLQRPSRSSEPSITVHWSNPPNSQLQVARDWAPIELVKKLPREDGNPVVAVRVDGMLRGLREPVGENSASADATLEFVRVREPDGKRVFWHSAAHVLGSALERIFGSAVLLCDGPPVLDGEGGFFYEFFLRGDAVGGAETPSLPETFLEDLERESNALIAANAPFERAVVNSIESVASAFSENPFKLDMLQSIPAGEAVSVYRCGSFVDLCRGPHVPSTGAFRAFSLHRVGASHWQPKPGSNVARTLFPLHASSKGLLLHRVYGIAFPDAPSLRAWQDMLVQARERDHRVVGARQGLFFFHDLSPGSAFLLPHGTRIYNAVRLQCGFRILMGICVDTIPCIGRAARGTFAR